MLFPPFNSLSNASNAHRLSLSGMEFFRQLFTTFHAVWRLQPSRIISNAKVTVTERLDPLAQCISMFLLCSLVVVVGGVRLILVLVSSFAWLSSVLDLQIDVSLVASPVTNSAAFPKSLQMPPLFPFKDSPPKSATSKRQYANSLLLSW